MPIPGAFSDLWSSKLSGPGGPTSAEVGTSHSRVGMTALRLGGNGQQPCTETKVSQPGHYGRFGLVILCCGGCPVQWKIFSNTLGLYLSVASNTAPNSGDNQPCLQTLPMSPGGKPPQLRPSVLDEPDLTGRRWAVGHKSTPTNIIFLYGTFSLNFKIQI